MSAGVVEQALLRIKLSQPQDAFQRGFKLGELLVHRAGFYCETLRSVGIANALTAGNRLVVLAEPRVHVANRARHGEIFRISLPDLFILSDGILQFPLLDTLLRSAESRLPGATKTNS